MNLDLYINSLKEYLKTHRGIDTFYFTVEDNYYEKVTNEAYKNGYEVIHVKEATFKNRSRIFFRRLRDLHYWMDKCTKLQQELEISSQEFLNLKHSVGYFISKAKQVETPEEVVTNIQEFITRMEDKYIKEDY